jgi:Arc/MetJ family transcription regulator
MRTNIEIDDRLMRKAMKSCGARTKKETVETALRLLADTHAQGAFRKFRGKVHWEGDLEQSRLSRFPE